MVEEGEDEERGMRWKGRRKERRRQGRDTTGGAQREMRGFPSSEILVQRKLVMCETKLAER